MKTTNKLFGLMVRCMVFLSPAAIAQAPQIDWQRTIGGSNSDKLKSIIKTTDGGIIAGGNSESTISGNKTVDTFGSMDIWLVKLDSTGTILWQNVYGGTHFESLGSLINTNDGGVLIGASSSSGISGNKTEVCRGLSDYWLVKLDVNGAMEWQRTYGGTNVDELFSLQQTSDNGYIVGGSSYSGISGDKTTGNWGYSDYWIIRLDSTGQLIWQVDIGGNVRDRLTSIFQTSDNGYFVGGYSSSINSGDKTESFCGSIPQDYWVLKLNSFGGIIWQNSIGGQNYDYLMAAIQTDDGGYFICGYSSSDSLCDKNENSTNYDFWVLKLNSIGNIVWQNTIASLGEDVAFSASKTSDGGFVISGYSGSPKGLDKSEYCIGSRDFWIVKIDSGGNVQWDKSVGGTALDFAVSISEIYPGNFIVGGYSDSPYSGIKSESCFGDEDYWIVKLTNSFNTIIGNLFIDSNSDQIRDSNEYRIPHKIVLDATTGKMGFSDPNGEYKIAVSDSGNFVVSPFPVAYYNPVPALHTVHFNGMYQTDSLNDFAFQPAGVYNDLCLSIVPAGSFRSGSMAWYQVKYENLGTTTLNATVVFYNDSNIFFVSSDVIPQITTSDSVVWNIGLIAPFKSGKITIQVQVNTGVPVGTLIHSSAQIEPIAGDASPQCNVDSWETYTTASYDPNAILVNKTKLLTTQFPNPPPLDYIVYFQNTGNDTAFLVRVLNNIPVYLDPLTLEIISSSHTFNFNYTSSSCLMEFTFNNILLPDSNTDDPNSHGFIHYRIRPENYLVAGDSIKNQAYIYFDNNAPVETNTAITEIKIPCFLPATHTVKACNSYISPSGSYIWTLSGTYSDTLSAAGGCDSVLTINLTIGTVNSFSIISIQACDSFVSPSSVYTWKSSGTFIDTIQNSTGCDSVITIHLTIKTVNTILVQNGSTLTSNLSFAVFQWLDCNNAFSPLPGQTGSVFTAIVDGNYAAAITYNGCTDTSDCYSIIGVGINETNRTSHFELFPNPATNHFIIELKDNSRATELSIIDITGKIIHTIAVFKKQRIETDTKKLAEGIYFVQVKTPQFIETKKLLIFN